MGLAGLLSVGNLAWASGPGTTAANVLGMGVGARAIGMGEAFTAMADDINSLYWNPAGLALLNQSAASFMYNQSYQGMNYNNANVGVSLENGGVAGSLSYLGYGSIDGFDETGAPTGNVNAYSGVATLGGGYLLDNWSVGLNAKAIHGALADVSATGGAVDLGTTFVYPQPILGGSTLRLATTLRNLGPGMKYLDQDDPLPTEWRVGGSLVQLFNQKANVSVDYGQARGAQSSLYAGTEYWLNPYLALRAGYTGNHTESNGLRLGLGLKIKDLSFDYAYASFGDLGMTNRYELTYRFGEIQPRLSAEERRLYRQAKADIRHGRYGQALLILDSLMHMEPKYKPFARTYKVALRDVEDQERYAKNLNTFTVNVPENSAASAKTAPELDDLESLLKMSDDASVAQNTAPSSGVKQ